MTRLTVVSAPKPFVDERIAIIQTNALVSWTRLPDVDIILMGGGHGIAEAAREHGAMHLASVRTNAWGTPLISSMVDLAQQHGAGDNLGIANADMILMGDLMEAVDVVRTKLVGYLILARRWDLDLTDALDFSRGWENRLRARAHERGKLHKPSGSDVFVFPRGLYPEVPDFAVGRAGWDNWMIFSARQRAIPVIDCTPSITMVHQNHDYAHLPGGVPHYALPETDENIRLGGGTAAIRYTVLDATHELRSDRLIRAPMSWDRSVRGIELLLRRVFFFLPSEKVEAVARPKRWRKRWERLIRGSGRKPSRSKE